METDSATPAADTLGDDGGLDAVRAQVAAGADVNGMLPRAILAEDPAILAFLLSHGADARTRDADGEPVLNLAIMALDWPAMNLLLEHGADLEASGPGGLTPVLLAATLNQFDQVERLIDRGADWRRPDNVGNSVAELVRTRALDPASELALAQGRLRARLDLSPS